MTLKLLVLIHNPVDTEIRFLMLFSRCSQVFFDLQYGNMVTSHPAWCDHGGLPVLKELSTTQAREEDALRRKLAEVHAKVCPRDATNT